MLGARNVYPIDNLFSGSSIATELLSSVRLLLVLNPEQARDALSALDRRAGVTVNSLEYDTEHWKLRYQLSEVSLRAALSLLEEVRELRNVEMSDTEDRGAPYELR